MTQPGSPTPNDAMPHDREAAVTALDSVIGEDYGPPETVDPDREAAEADQLEQTVEVPVDDDADPEPDDEA